MTADGWQNPVLTGSVVYLAWQTAGPRTALLIGAMAVAAWCWDNLR